MQPAALPSLLSTRAPSAPLTLPIPTMQDIATVYQIFPDEVLGSGQFGVVYGGTDASELIQRGSRRFLGSRPSVCSLPVLVDLES